MARSPSCKPIGGIISKPRSQASQSFKPNKADWLDGRWAGLRAAAAGAEDDRRGRTGVDRARLTEIGLRLTTVPEGFDLHRTIRRLLDNRRKMIETGEGIDWAMAEALAFAALVDEGYPVRLSGQDSERGTFSQRHSVLIDQETEARYIPLNNIRDEQAHFEVINSMLSEEAVLGFEYGYSLAEPNALVLWEAQFGDFANGAQVVFDQFISSGERKWLRMSGLVCLLPHGYEGQGPEHSSARLERYLQLCAEDNMQVANCTTPANYFHILRRQLKRDIRKPLILMTPKSLLRHKRAVSKLDEFAIGASFHRILLDDAEHGAGRNDEPSSRTPRSAGWSCVPAKSITISSRSARSGASTTSICCGSSSSIPSRSRRSSRLCRGSRRPTSSGARKSRRTWAPGASSILISNGCWPRRAARPSGRSMRAGPPPRPPRPG